MLGFGETFSHVRFNILYTSLGERNSSPNIRTKYYLIAFSELKTLFVNLPFWDLKKAEVYSERWKSTVRVFSHSDAFSSVHDWFPVEIKAAKLQGIGRAHLFHKSTVIDVSMNIELECVCCQAGPCPQRPCLSRWLRGALIKINRLCLVICLIPGLESECFILLQVYRGNRELLFWRWKRKSH